MLEALHEWVVHTIADHGLVAIFALMLLESACIPIPSEVTMLFGGALTSAAFIAEGAAEGQALDFWAVVMAGTLGNVVGSWLAYWAGAVGGRPLVDRFGRYLLIRPHEVDRAHGWFERRGELTVFVSRLLPVVRTFISVPAGVAGMPFWRFTAYTFLGCLPWSALLAWGGRAFGDRWETIQHALEPLSWAIAAVMLALGGIYVARRWRKVRTEYAALDARRDEAAGL